MTDVKHMPSIIYKKKLRERYDPLFKFTVVRNPFERYVSYWHSPHWESERYKGLKPKSLYDLINKVYTAEYLAPGMDAYIRFESLQAGFDMVCERIDIPKVKLPTLNTSKHGAYRDYYDTKTRELAREKGKWEIDNFGYEY